MCRSPVSRSPSWRTCHLPSAPRRFADCWPTDTGCARRCSSCSSRRRGESWASTRRPFRRDVAPWYTVELVATLPATAFRPVPTVNAGVLRITARRPTLLTPAAFADHICVVDAAFHTGRGQTVAERLGPFAGRPAAARWLLEAAGIDPGATPSQLRPESWAAITRALSCGVAAGR
jgi:hypothetical protein